MRANLDFLHDPRLQAAMGALENAGFEALVVGGAARDGLMGNTPKDIDLATNAHPDAVAQVLGAAGAEMRPTGLDHGTWTAVLGGEGYEITTYRRDVSTDGRRATVAWAETFAQDAARRDFTINAIGLTRNGDRVDPTGQGLDDLAARRLRFVGDGHARCAEDSLRALRLFRFQGRFGAWPMDKHALHAAAGADLSGLSGERVWSEVKGILHSPQAPAVAAAMDTTGTWGKILPNTALNHHALAATVHREEAAGLSPSWAARLYALTGRERLPWPVSGAEAKRLTLIARHADTGWSPKVAAAATGSADTATDLWAVGTHPCAPNTVRAQAHTGQEARLPVTSADLRARGVANGPKMGALLQQCRETWLASELGATTAGLLDAHLPVRAQSPQR